MRFDPRSKLHLKVLEMVLTKHKNPDETDKVKTSGSSNDASTSGVLMESEGMESRLCSSPHLPGPEWNNPHTLVSSKLQVSDDTLPRKPG